VTNSATSLLMISAKIRSAVPDLSLAALIGDQARQNIGADVSFILGQLTIDSPTLHCGQPVSKCIGIAGGPLCPFLPAIRTRLFVTHFGSDRRFHRAKSHSSGIRSVPGILIRFHSGFHSSKVMAKLQNSLVLSCGYTCYENFKSSCRFDSIFLER
jgi:hypothetical protein